MLSQATAYAAAALSRLARAGGQSLLVKAIADDCGIPHAYLAKIINTLARKGLVSTQRGIGGGVALARPPAAVTLHDVCTALDDPIIQCRCLLAEVGCDDERACPAHAFWKPQREQTIAYLRRTTLAELAAFAERRRATATPARRRQPRR